MKFGNFKNYASFLIDILYFVKTIIVVTDTVDKMNMNMIFFLTRIYKNYVNNEGEKNSTNNNFCFPAQYVIVRGFEKI